ncbi:cofilin/tropomyosin-type actin-binding protein [Stagonosporopsis vannaccii]|nr:cofilin/tropomyosin-type actin-binding protein [Stagonosporopsis vannaccii]
MSSAPLTIPSAVQEAFRSLLYSNQALALILTLEETVVHAHPVIQSKGQGDSFQSNLNLLDDVLDPKTSLYLLLRRCNSVFAITFVPYQAPEHQRGHIERSLICKEIGEITDARSWAERDADQQETGNKECADVCESSPKHGAFPKDAGYKKNKCRLCDRRMKNKITDGALQALGKLKNEGDLVQISLNPDLILSLDLQISCLLPEQVPSHLPITHPSFTLYRHPNKLLYFIFHSPDSATVQQRMKHTMAIPGLVNVHAEDYGVHVDQRVEIHEPEDLVFDEGDDKVGRFRSVYLRNMWQGTESQYEGLERDKMFYDAVK